MKFTFKLNKDLWHSDQIDVKLKRILVGTMRDEVPVKVRFKIRKVDLNEDGNPNCPWMWKTMVRKFNTVNEAKEYLRVNTDRLVSELNIYTEAD